MKTREKSKQIKGNRTVEERKNPSNEGKKKKGRKGTTEEKLKIESSNSSYTREMRKLLHKN